MFINKYFVYLNLLSFTMLKRKSEGGGDEAPNKKNQSGIAAEGMVNPIPRHLPQQTITLNFYQSTWEEVGPGQMYYLPLCQNPKYMFDAAMRQQFNKFKELWGTMEIHTPKVRISNLIMLQDDLRVQNSTPTDATAFTQVVYMIKYCPKAQKQYFKLGSLDKEDMTAVKDITYELKPIKSEIANPTQLVTLTGFENFEKLTIHNAKSDYTAGFVPGKLPTLDTTTYKIEDPYISPNSTSLLSAFSGNLNPPNKYFISPTYSITMARNLDKKEFYKYGDVIEYPINTNLEGVHLFNTLANNFLEEQIIEVEDQGKKIKYEGEFCWPSRNRPFLSRGNYFHSSTEPITEGKKFKELEHCFLTMPPIRKPGGALLGQRCSFLLEQSMSITLHMSQGTFFPDESDDALQMNQDNSVVIRRNVYPTPDVSVDTVSIYCIDSSLCKKEAREKLKYKRGKPIVYADKKCYDDSYKGFHIYLQDNPAIASIFDIEKFCSFQHADVLPPGAFNCSTLPNSQIVLDNADGPEYVAFKKYWHDQLYKDGKLYLYWLKTKQPPKDQDNEHWVYMTGDANMNMPLIKQGLDVEFPNYVVYNIAEFLAEQFFPRVLNLCFVPYKKQAPVANRVCNVFFT